MYAISNKQREDIIHLLVAFQKLNPDSVKQKNEKRKAALLLKQMKKANKLI